MFDITKLVSGGLVKLYNEVDDTTVNPVIELYPVQALKYQVDNDPGNDVLLTELVITLTADRVDDATFLLLSEQVYVTGGTIVTKPDGTDVVQYTADVRGLFNINKNNPPTAADGGSVNYKSHKQNAVVTIPEDYLIRYLYSIWQASTSVEPCELGEDIAEVGWVISLHTDGKFYKYHNVNYPDAQGMLNEVGTAGQTKTYTNLRGIKVGLTGLTANSFVYGENGVKYTHTPSATTVLVGKTKGTTAVLLDIAVPGTAPASQAQAEAGVVQGVYMDPLRTKQAFDYNMLSQYNMFGTGADGDLTVTGTTTLTPDVIYNYNNVTIENGGILKLSAAGTMILKVKGNFEIKAGGKIDLKGLGGSGGSAVSITSPGGVWNTNATGNDGVAGTSVYAIESTTKGQKGNGNSNSDHGVGSGGSGGSGRNAASASSAATSVVTAAASSAGTAITADKFAYALSRVYVGAGGASGGVGAGGNALASTLNATSGTGGAGGGGLIVFIKGTCTINGTVDLSGVNGGNASANVGAVNTQGAGGGGGGGGAAGAGFILYQGVFSGTPTYTTTGGTGGNGASASYSTGGGASSNGTNGSDGLLIVNRIA